MAFNLISREYHKQINRMKANMDDNHDQGVPWHRGQGLADFEPATDLHITNMDVNVLAQDVSLNGFNSREKPAAAFTYANANVETTSR